MAESNGVIQTNGKHSLEESSTSRDLKRPRENDSEQPASAKKARTVGRSDDDVVVVDDDPGNGAIVID